MSLKAPSVNIRVKIDRKIPIQCSGGIQRELSSVEQFISLFITFLFSSPCANVTEIEKSVTPTD